DFHVTGVQTCALPISITPIVSSSLRNSFRIAKGGIIPTTVDLCDRRSHHWSSSSDCQCSPRFDCGYAAHRLIVGSAHCSGGSVSGGSPAIGHSAPFCPDRKSVV